MVFLVAQEMQTESSRLNELHVNIFLGWVTITRAWFCSYKQHTKALSSTYLQILVLQTYLDPEKNGVWKVEQ